MRAITFTGAGGPEVMRFVERPDPEPGSSQVLVEVSFAGVNPADLARRAGYYPAAPGSPPDIPGLEVAGVVVATGSGVSRWAAGDRVFGLVGGGGLADRVVVDERHLAAVPADLTDEQAAAVPEAFITAHDALITQAELGRGDVLLVTGANGGVGTAAVQLASATGATVFASARADDCHAGLTRFGATPARPGAVTDAVRAAGGADVVLELVGGTNLAADLEALAPGGRIVFLVPGPDPTPELPLMRLIVSRARLFGSALSSRSLIEKAAAIDAFAHAVLPLLETGRVVPVIDRVFAAQDAADAFAHMTVPGKLGRVLLAF
jgi:NADPH:quinone reductase-like Zn-dependent oxidoreductase